MNDKEKVKLKLTLMGPRRKTVLSWAVVGLGFLIGLFGLTIFGMQWPPFGDHEAGWFLRWYGYAGVGLFGLVFTVPSLIAPRNRKLAGWLFLALTPVTAFCLAYPDAGYLVWESDGSGVFHSPFPFTAIGLSALFFLPFPALLLLKRSRKLAICLFLISACASWTVIGYSRWAYALVPRLTGCAAPFALFGIFWLATARLGWPPLVPLRPRRLLRRIAAFSITCFAVLCLVVGLTLGLSVWGSTLFGGDCAGTPAFSKPLYPGQAVFTARIIYVGRSIEAQTRSKGVLYDTPDARLGDWAIGVVREDFWGLPSWKPRVVLLTNHLFWKDVTYFVFGRRKDGAVTRVFPIVDAGPCGGASPEYDAVAQLSSLRKPQSGTGGRILGLVHGPDPFVGIANPPAPPTPVGGAIIKVTGPAGETTVKTGETGLYELDDLPPGDYTLQGQVPDNQLVDFYGDENLPAKVHLEKEGLVVRNFPLFWNGRIEGRVTDESRHPVHVWVEIADAAGKRLPGYVNSSLRTGDDGSYRINKIPPGRYILMINPYGPADLTPYDFQFYRQALRQVNAQVLTLAKGQEMNGIDFQVHSLAKRPVEVRVTTQDGKPATDAVVLVAYEHTEGFASIRQAGYSEGVDSKGVCVLHLYGNTRVRITAYQTLEDLSVAPADQPRIYSRAVEFEAENAPDKLELVLTSPAP